ncbi:MAG: alkaline phosphatase D family protein [Bacteroidota bacterium]
MLSKLKTSLLFAIIIIVAACSDYQKPTRDLGYPEPILIAGEPASTNILLHARLNSKDTIGNPYKGMDGIALFEISIDSNFQQFYASSTKNALAENDYTIKYRSRGLIPSTKYYYRLKFGKDDKSLQYSRIATFKTLPASDSEETVSMVMVTGTHYDRFYLGGNFGMSEKSSQGKAAYDGADKALGYPAHASILQLKPDIFIANGDNVYYDHPPFNKATTVEAMRHKWHQQFFLERYRNLLDNTTTIWLKDDHDYRYDDADTLAENAKHGPLPTHEDGIKTFIEQVPFLMQEDSTAKPYRTMKMGKHLQLWLLEGRDYRSPNGMTDSEDKTIWGTAQKEWLKKGLLQSEATFKILVSPTPMIGPDDKRKTDNHTNVGGFRFEGEAFFNWLTENEFQDKNFYIFCGDRHWQYHSISPEGIEEFSSGALVDQNARLGRLPGDPNSTDPEGKVSQPFTSPEASGGFLWAEVLSSTNGEPTLHIKLYDETGKMLYEATKMAAIPSLK